MGENKRKDKKNKIVSTSKVVLFIVFLVCIEIIIFAQYAMLKLGDISAMYVLIGVPVSLVPVILGYYWKSKNENTVGGITYDIAMKEKESDFSCDTVIEEESPI